ncbi:hypothetical protein KY347_07090 [Candidatus Woesearchaeota archaeon]|nr:hypothetical protein [Candidatus Woesearchaeota archaeon]
MPKKQKKQVKSKKPNKAKAIKASTKESAEAIEVSSVKKLLSTTPEQHSFFVADGTKISSLTQLLDALEAMHEDTYRFHANENRNDFSNWVKDIFEDEQLAESLKTAGTKTEAQLLIAKRLLKEAL